MTTAVRTSALVSFIALAALLFGAMPAAGAQAPDPRELALTAPWSFVTLAESGPVDAVLADEAIDAAFRWDADAQAFDSWRRDAPPALNSLTEIAAGDAVWLRLSADTTLTQPPLPAGAIAVRAGWNALAWNGAGTPAGDAAGLLGATSIFRWDATAQTFESFDVDAPGLINTLASVRPGDALWIFAEAAAEVELPAAGAEQGEPAPFTLTSAAFAEGEMIPVRYTCDGDNVSPPLMLAGLPDGTASLAILVEDPDAPGGTFDHWVEWNIPPTVAIPEDAGPLGVQGTSDLPSPGYGGPCPPPADDAHRYRFTVFAADTMLELAAGADKAALLAALDGHILAQASLTGLYDR